MRFNPKARLDKGQVSDAGGGGGRGGGLGGGGGMRLPIPTGAGGGKLGLAIAVIFFVVAMCTGNVPGINQGGGGGGGGGGLGLDPSQLQAAGGQSAETDRYASCRTGEDAAASHDCGRVAVVNSIQAYWAETLPEAAGVEYTDAQTVTFSGSISTGCGQASAAVGPFYCPAPGDQKVYLDTNFFDDVLEGQLGGPDGGFVEWYVLGHEYGHHIQDITNQMRNVKTQQGENSDAVKLELQADCYAGLWTNAAVNTEDESGEPLFSEGPNEEDLRQAIAAAEAVGDDHIQKVSQGRVDPGQWTHGSSAQRIEMFKKGYESGDYSACDVW
ncbi:peptidase [Nocardioides sp. JQ2195]|uniref:KPN_02809 family neutral zinc metallopeptidase n=1 Tax=Nocardioides sp. JQ2195 TaxID=2592334 RepID=UPI00143E7191|nr:neutral zinc metallopeptidase [Nocardioides sp. JQ2195]QIX26777.1 peptidase [Nocardioides sp. JQ2195]